jgi:20S proteasome alpha/beta subunit
MTLLVGVLCSNGAVIAADRQAMHGAMGQMTVGQAVTKVRIIGSNTLFASSGHGGLGQQLSAIVEGKGLQFSAVSYAQSIADLQNHFRVLVHRFPDTDPILAMREDSVFRHGM